MKALPLIISLALLTGVVNAVVPQWVQPGVTATYDMYSSFIRNGQPNSAVHVLITMQVDSVSEEGVTGTVQTYNPTTGLSNTQTVACPEGGVGCLGRFWLDPQSPSQSIKGDGGVAYKQAGRTTYDYGGQTLDAAVLSYKVPDKGIDFHIIYDPETGLILSNVLKYPNEQVYVFFNSIRGVGDTADGVTPNDIDVSVDGAQDY